MPPSISLGLLVLGGVLILIGFVGGNFKLFGADVAGTISNPWLRLLTALVGLFFIFLALNHSPTGGYRASPPPAPVYRGVEPRPSVP